MCAEYRARNQLREPAVIVIAGYALCARHWSLVEAIRDDAALQEPKPRRRPALHRRRGITV